MFRRKGVTCAINSAWNTKTKDRHECWQIPLPGLFCYDSEQGIDGLHMSSDTVGKMPELFLQNRHIFNVRQLEEVDIELFSTSEAPVAHLWKMVEGVIVVLVVAIILRSTNDGMVRRRDGLTKQQSFVAIQ